MLNGTGIPLEEGASGKLLGQNTVLNQSDIYNHVFAPEDCICHPVASGEKCFQKGREALSPEASSVTQAISQSAKLPWVPVIPSCSRKALSDALSPFSLSAPLWGGQDGCHSHRISNPSPQDWVGWDPVVREWWRWGQSLGFQLIIQSFFYTPVASLGAWRWLSLGDGGEVQMPRARPADALLSLRSARWLVLWGRCRCYLRKTFSPRAKSAVIGKACGRKGDRPLPQRETGRRARRAGQPWWWRWSDRGRPPPGLRWLPGLLEPSELLILAPF